MLVSSHAGKGGILRSFFFLFTSDLPSYYSLLFFFAGISATKQF